MHKYIICRAHVKEYARSGKTRLFVTEPRPYRNAHAATATEHQLQASAAIDELIKLRCICHLSAFTNIGLCQAPSAAINASACFGPQLPGW